jgi:putative protease
LYRFADKSPSIDPIGYHFTPQMVETSTTIPENPPSNARPELLSPVGDWDALRAAVANGADAVYFGLSGFNARHRAANFTLEELPGVIQYLHEHNVRGYVAFNTLIFSDELEEAAEFLKAIARAGADAIIVQDLGLAELAREICPTLSIHGSTQMTLTEPLGIEFVRKLGVQRAILARELSSEDIARIASQTPVPLEVFIHGALCVSYSGQCLTSESIGQRSANRGQCAQACRLPYDLIVDGVRRDLGDKAYLLSSQDLAAYDMIDELARIGVACLKIEGRLKSPHYVAAATQTYRAAIDAIDSGKSFDLSQRQQSDLAQSFSRGFTHGFLDGVNHQMLVHARFPKSRGVRAGSVVAKTERSIIIELAPHAHLKPGDGIVFDEGHPEQDEQGGRIDRVNPNGRGRVEISFFGGDVNLLAVADRCTVWKTDDPEVKRRLEHSYSQDRNRRRAPIFANVEAKEGENLTIDVADDRGNRTQVAWDRPLEKALKFPASREIFEEQFGRLGDTPFELAGLRVNGDENNEFPAVMIPKSVLNDLRRRAATELMRLRESKQNHAIADSDGVQTLRSRMAEMPPIAPIARPQLYVLTRTMEQLEAALAWKSPAEGIDRPLVYCELEDVRRYPQAVALAKSAGVPIGLATLRIVKPSERGLLRAVALANPDTILVRNLAGLVYYAEHFPAIPLIADYALNAANEITASILAREKFARITPSYDLNWKQLTAMLGRFPPGMFEVVIHQHMPMFHMEHCVFAHVLSNGKDYRDCGRPCEKHGVELRDRASAAHPLVADAGCRNTVYNGAAQSAAEFVPRMLELGLRHFRVELLRNSAAEVGPLLDRYARVLAGLDDPRNAWRQLKVLNQLGVTRGTLE